MDYTTDDCDTVAVTATRVSEAHRMQAIEQHFGHLGLHVERAVFTWMRELAADHRGGYWHFHELSNGGFYMAPSSPERLELHCVGNQFRGEMSTDAAGIVATLFALSHLSFAQRDERIAYHYHWLRDFAASHPEASLIFQAID